MHQIAKLQNHNELILQHSLEKKLTGVNLFSNLLKTSTSAAAASLPRRNLSVRGYGWIPLSNISSVNFVASPSLSALAIFSIRFVWSVKLSFPSPGFPPNLQKISEVWEHGSYRVLVFIKVIYLCWIWRALSIWFDSIELRKFATADDTDDCRSAAVTAIISFGSGIANGTGRLFWSKKSARKVKISCDAWTFSSWREVQTLNALSGSPALPVMQF
jgi:hypothetical protein